MWTPIINNKTHTFDISDEIIIIYITRRFLKYIFHSGNFVSTYYTKCYIKNNNNNNALPSNAIPLIAHNAGIIYPSLYVVYKYRIWIRVQNRLGEKKNIITILLWNYSKKKKKRQTAGVNINFANNNWGQ